MTPKKQQIAIAEACGWRKEYIHGNGMDCDFWIHPDGKQGWPAELVQLPDYLNDLNAMHEAEKVLTDANCVIYYDTLSDLVLQRRNGRASNWIFHATAAQRAEAFLKTLNLWK